MITSVLNTENTFVEVNDILLFRNYRLLVESKTFIAICNRAADTFLH